MNSEKYSLPGDTNLTILSIILIILSIFLIILKSSNWHFDNLCDLGFDLSSYVSGAQLVSAWKPSGGGGRVVAVAGGLTCV